MCDVHCVLSRWSAEELLEHPFVHHKAYVYLYERELSQICDKILHYFRQYPDRTTTPISSFSQSMPSTALPPDSCCRPS
jgi:hypothetical protein